MKKTLLVGISLISLIFIFIVLGILIIKKYDELKKDVNNYPNIEGADNIKESNGSKINVSSELKKSQKYGNYTLTNAKLETKDGLTTFTINIKNEINKKQLGRLIEIVFVDKKGNDISKMNAYISDLGSLETAQLTAFINKDLSNAYNYHFKTK